jgi:signal transduction histidine kinase
MNGMGTRALLERKAVGGALAVCAGLSVALLAGFGYAAVRGWQRSSLALSNRRTEEAAGVLVSALTKDMQAVQRSVLVSADSTESILAPPLDELGTVASAFARYPYAEWFFASNDAHPSAPAVLFARRDRTPAWLLATSAPNHFPVVFSDDPAIGPVLAERIGHDVIERRRFSVFEVTFRGTLYQVITRLLYRNPLRTEISAIVGVGVNMTWVREHYFPEMTRQIGRVDGGTVGVALSVVDDQGQRVAGTGTATGNAREVRRSLPLTFFDPLLLTPNAPPDLPRREWTVRAASSNDPTLAEASRGATRMLVLGAVAVVVLVLGAVLTLRASVSSVRLAELRADFVSSVTHELKTPIATIRAAAETLLAGRITDPAAQHDYAVIAVQEAKRLTQLIDNLLAFSRVTDTHVVHEMQPVRLDALVADTLRRFDLHLRSAGFHVRVEFPPDLPSVLGDPTALRLMLDNVVDNAIRYTRDEHCIEITGRISDDAVVLEISDRGIGIHPNDVAQVTQKFFRARNARPGGAGVGLAIVDRIVTDHRGTFALRSAIDQGTTVVVTLPMAPATT